jgi:hypothetical protein
MWKADVASRIPHGVRFTCIHCHMRAIVFLFIVHAWTRLYSRTCVALHWYTNKHPTPQTHIIHMISRKRSKRAIRLQPILLMLLNLRGSAWMHQQHTQTPPPTPQTHVIKHKRNKNKHDCTYLACTACSRISELICSSSSKAACTSVSSACGVGGKNGRV